MMVHKFLYLRDQFLVICQKNKYHRRVCKKKFTIREQNRKTRVTWTRGEQRWTFQHNWSKVFLSFSVKVKCMGFFLHQYTQKTMNITYAIIYKHSWIRFFICNQLLKKKTSAKIQYLTLKVIYCG